MNSRLRFVKLFLMAFWDRLTMSKACNREGAHVVVYQKANVK